MRRPRGALLWMVVAEFVDESPAEVELFETEEEARKAAEQTEDGPDTQSQDRSSVYVAKVTWQSGFSP